MNYCKQCNVYVDDGLRYCPLCGAEMTDHPQENEMYPPVQRRRYVDRRSLTMDYFLLATFVVITLCIVINGFTWDGRPWFLGVAAPVLYAWILIKVTILSDLYAGLKAFLQMITLFAMLLAFDFISGFHGWSYSFFLPLILALGIAYIDLYSYYHKTRWRDNLMYAILFVALGFLPIILYFLGVRQSFWMMCLSTFGSVITILGLLRFTYRYLKLEMRKRFHM